MPFITNYIQQVRIKGLVDNLLATESVTSLPTEEPAAKKFKRSALEDDPDCDKILSAIQNLEEDLFTLKQIKDIPFPSIIEETDRFTLYNDVCFT